MEIRLSCTEGADRDALQKRIAKTLHILLSSKGITPPEITFGDRIEKPKGKKLKRVERRYRLGKEKHEQGVLH